MRDLLTPEKRRPLDKARTWFRARFGETETYRIPSGTAFLVLLIVAGILFALWKLPAWEVSHARGTTAENQFSRENDARKTLAEIVGGIAFLAGLYMSFKTFDLSREGQITDRFSKAIEQLGAVNKNDQPSIEIRLGGIYALERIAFDSPRDHWTIMEILTAYVRRNAPLESGRAYEKGEEPRTDIQAALTVLGRRRTGPNREQPDFRLNLTRTRLCGARLVEANLQQARFNQADLQGANLIHANLQEAALTEALLQGALLMDANLHDATLNHAQMQGANLAGASLEHSLLYATNLAGARFFETRLDRASLFSANLQDAIELKAEQVKSANFWQAATFSPDLRAALGLDSEEEEDSKDTGEEDDADPAE